VVQGGLHVLSTFDDARADMNSLKKSHTFLFSSTSLFYVRLKTCKSLHWVQQRITVTKETSFLGSYQY
jgi:hypothetical protein